MHFMNEWEVEGASTLYAQHPILGPATRTLANLVQMANESSDGWAYWPKPARAADRLMTLIKGDPSWQPFHWDRQDVTEAQLRKAYTPIKAFLTRSGMSCELVMPEEAR